MWLSRFGLHVEGSLHVKNAIYFLDREIKIKHRFNMERLSDGAGIFGIGNRGSRPDLLLQAV